ncbi:unnamed protein product [Nippostrongylus brasiliensis]|uniref:Uncharacterized protein n=1 Tax=Nippostrongylus brasiliensis TaxID=27835 RepID=A0A0N4XRW7_NIPBR|nr:unnamed protein product [Nippostrongylus brasiliensis]
MLNIFLQEFTGTTGKRSKAERVEHKHTNPGNDTRKVVQIAQNGEAKRREQALACRLSLETEIPIDDYDLISFCMGCTFGRFLYRVLFGAVFLIV